jgi:hypothetical protein
MTSSFEILHGKILIVDDQVVAEQKVSGRIQLTNSTRQKSSEAFMLEAHGAIEVKGKGQMHTWFLNGRNA